MQSQALDGNAPYNYWKGELIRRSSSKYIIKGDGEVSVDLPREWLWQQGQERDEEYRIHLHRFQVPRKLRGSHGILLYQSATHGSSDCLLSATEVPTVTVAAKEIGLINLPYTEFPTGLLTVRNFPPNVVDCLLIIYYVTSWLPLAVWEAVAINWWQL